MRVDVETVFTSSSPQPTTVCDLITKVKTTLATREEKAITATIQTKYKVVQLGRYVPMRHSLLQAGILQR
jgi:hypothetical protein